MAENSKMMRLKENKNRHMCIPGFWRSGVLLETKNAVFQA